jgi:hypothetical protein
MRRLFPALSVANQSRSAYGRQYSGTPGQAIDVPDTDSDVLCANGWIFVALSGPTSARPTAATVPSAQTGLHYFDSTLGIIVVFDGAVFRDPATGNAV